MLTVICLTASALLTATAVWQFHRRVRRRAERIASADVARSEQVHALQRLNLTAMLGAALGGWVFGAGAYASVLATRPLPKRHHGDAGFGVEILVASLVAMVALIGFLLAARRGVRPVIERVRQITFKRPGRGRRAVGGFVVAIVFYGALAAGSVLIPHRGAAHVLGVALLWPVVLLVTQLLMPPLFVFMVGARPLPEPQAEQMRGLARQMGTHVRSVRVFPARAQKMAQAVQLGVLPGLRYVLVTDYLVDELSPEELQAVVAHEFGHAKRHHVLAKLLAFVPVLFGLSAGIGALTAGKHGAIGGLVAGLAIPVAYIAVTIAVQGLLGIRLEERADDAAARAVGAQHLADALSHIAELNDTKRDTGRGWAVLTQHPGIDARIARLRSA